MGKSLALVPTVILKCFGGLGGVRYELSQLIDSSLSHLCYCISLAFSHTQMTDVSHAQPLTRLTTTTSRMATDVSESTPTDSRLYVLRQLSSFRFLVQSTLLDNREEVGSEGLRAVSDRCLSSAIVLGALA